MPGEGTGRGTRGALSRLAASLGFRRILWVRVVVRPIGTTADATGLLHRHPRTVPIPMATAARLASAGAPVRIVDAGERGERGHLTGSSRHPGVGAC